MRPLRLLSILVLLLGLAGSSSAETLTLGEPLDATLEETEIAIISSDPDAWEGERVRIQGVVDGVCSMQGCWMDLVAEDESTLRIKVDDGVIVFPSEAIGQTAVAEGVVEIIKMEKERYVAWMRHVADEEDREFDPASIGDGPYRLVQVRGHGAEVELP